MTDACTCAGELVETHRHESDDGTVDAWFTWRVVTDPECPEHGDD